MEVTYWDLKEVNNNYGSYYTVKRCSRCNREVENNFEYCPYCGEKDILFVSGGKKYCSI